VLDHATAASRAELQRPRDWHSTCIAWPDDNWPHHRLERAPGVVIKDNVTLSFDIIANQLP